MEEQITVKENQKSENIRFRIEVIGKTVELYAVKVNSQALLTAFSFFANKFWHYPIQTPTSCAFRQGIVASKLYNGNANYLEWK